MQESMFMNSPQPVGAGKERASEGLEGGGRRAEDYKLILPAVTVIT